MHELSIAQGLVDVACESLEHCDPPAGRVRSVLVRIGALSGIVPEALEFCYGMVVKGTALDGSRLVIQEQPVVVFCPRCLENRTLGEELQFRCPSCNTPTPEIVHGRELELISMELIDPDEPPAESEEHDDPGPFPTDPRSPPGPAQGQ